MVFEIVEIVKAIVDEVLNLGGSDEDVRRILKDENLRKGIAELIVKIGSVITSTFRVTVDYGKTFAEMVAAGKYNWVNSDITQEHFPVSGEGKKETEIVLFHFGKTMSSDAVLAEMEEAGYRPAKIEELLALGAIYPELQKEFIIVALGSLWQNPLGRRYVPCLFWLVVERYLSLHWFELVWREFYRFAGVRK